MKLFHKPFRSILTIWMPLCLLLTSCSTNTQAPAAPDASTEAESEQITEAGNEESIDQGAAENAESIGQGAAGTSEFVRLLFPFRACCAF